jgi:hypothetical protein
VYNFSEMCFTGITPYLRLERGRPLVYAFPRDVQFAKCPIAWRTRHYKEADELGASVTRWYTWQGALIPAADWREEIVPVLTPYEHKWDKKVAPHLQEGVSSLVEEIQSTFLDRRYVFGTAWEKGKETTEAYEAYLCLESLYEAVNVSPHGGKIPSKERLFLYRQHLHDFLESCRYLTQHMRAEGERILARLEEYLGY